MDPNQPTNGDELDKLAVWFFLIGLLYRQIMKRQRAIRYNSVLTGDDRVTEFLNGH